MAKNDTILIDCIIDDILESQGAEKNSTAIGKTFEVFAVQQILKKYALSDDDIESCCTDDKADSGFDYIFLFVNDCLVKDGYYSGQIIATLVLQNRIRNSLIA